MPHCSFHLPSSFFLLENTNTDTLTVKFMSCLNGQRGNLRRTLEQVNKPLRSMLRAPKASAQLPYTWLSLALPSLLLILYYVLSVVLTIFHVSIYIRYCVSLVALLLLCTLAVVWKRFNSAIKASKTWIPESLMSKTGHRSHSKSSNHEGNMTRLSPANLL